MKIKCLVIDDELPAIEQMVDYIGRVQFLECTATFDNALDALPYLKANPVDLIFLDIEMERFTGQLNTILGHFEALKEADTGDIAGTTHVVPMINVVRPDHARPSLTPDEALANAPERRDDLFKVPRVVE